MALIAAAPAWSQDTTPEAFTFNDQTGAEPSAMVESNTITVTGIDTAAAISVTAANTASAPARTRATPAR